MIAPDEPTLEEGLPLDGDAAFCPEEEALPSEKGPERTCIVTRTKGSPDTMIRFVLGPDLTVVPDIRRKLPGRGVWVTAQAARLAEAVKRQAFAKGFKAKVNVSASLIDDVEGLLRQDCLQFLSLVNKSGSVITGFAKVEAAIESGQVVGLIHAIDGGSDGVRKLGQVLRRRFGEEAQPPQIKLFSNEELDLALGRTNVIHAALVGSATSRAFMARSVRLLGFKTNAMPEQVGRLLASSEELTACDIKG